MKIYRWVKACGMICICYVKRASHFIPYRKDLNTHEFGIYKRPWSNLKEEKRTHAILLYIKMDLSNKAQHQILGLLKTNQEVTSQVIHDVSILTGTNPSSFRLTQYYSNTWVGKLQCCPNMEGLWQQGWSYPSPPTSHFRNRRKGKLESGCFRAESTLWDSKKSVCF